MKRHVRILPLLLAVSILFISLPSITFAATLKIVSIKDLSASVFINQNYTLPTTVDATMSNKIIQKVAVTWNPKTVVTSKTGTFVYQGTVKGYSKQVLLTLKVLKAPDSEILRAISYGFVPNELQGDWDKTITFNQYCTMMEKMLTLYDSKLISKWEEVASHALASNNNMHRDHGMMATYYAACVMGLGQTTNANWHLDEKYGIEMVNGFDNDFGKWFPEFTKTAPFYDIDYIKRLSGWNYDTCSRYWSVGQTSCVSGNPIFDIDFLKKTVRPKDSFTRKEAIHAVLRVYESTFKQTDILVGSDKKSAEILALADIRRDSIINSKTTITKSDTFVQGKTYTGTAYYVANSGNDSNDGMTPETAWATIEKVNSMGFKYGDAVFFNRGDIWYGNQIWGQEGVTYSAYGVGPKPIMSGSLAENAATPDKWKLFYEDKSGKKIWVFYKDILNCAGIFFNGGKIWANEITAPLWNGKEYLTSTGKKFDVVAALTQNLDYFTYLDLTNIDPFNNISETGVTGPLYLRCDAGNPGDLYDKIDFSLDGIGISPSGENGKSMTVDNIQLEFWGSMGVGLAGYQGWTNSIVQNCEIGWCGGQLSRYIKEGNRVDIIYSGCAIQMSGSQNTAINNYIHHCASKTFAIVLYNRKSTSFIYSDILIKGNLLEYNATAWHLLNPMERDYPTIPSGFKNVNFDDNYVMYTGYGWVETKNQRSDIYMENLPISGIEFGGDYKNKNEGMNITNNIFYLAKYALVNCFMPKENQPIFSGNIYAQGENGWLALWRGKLLSITENGDKYMRNELLDKTGTVITVK